MRHPHQRDVAPRGGRHEILQCQTHPPDGGGNDNRTHFARPKTNRNACRGTRNVVATSTVCWSAKGRKDYRSRLGVENQGAHRYHSIFRLLDTQRRNLVRRNRRAHRSVERLPLDGQRILERFRNVGTIPWNFVLPATGKHIPESRILRSRRREANPVLGNQVKRLAVSLGGLLFGLLVTWAFFYAFSRLHWHGGSGHVATGCSELGKCPIPWWSVPLVIGYLCGPAIAFCLLNAVAWRRWSARKWVGGGAVILVFTAVLYVTDSLMKQST